MILSKFILSHREHRAHREAGLVSRCYELTKVIIPASKGFFSVASVAKALVVDKGFVKALPA